MSVVSYPHVVLAPSLFHGEPHIEGLRIRVRDIVLARDQGGYTPEEIASTVYPELSLAQAYSALAHFEDRRAEIEQAVQREHDALRKSRRCEDNRPTTMERLLTATTKRQNREGGRAGLLLLFVISVGAK